MKIPSSNLGRTCWVQKLFLTFWTIFVYNMFSPCSAKRRASDKYLPVSYSKTPVIFLLCTDSINECKIFQNCEFSFIKNFIPLCPYFKTFLRWRNTKVEHMKIYHWRAIKSSLKKCNSILVLLYALKPKKDTADNFD